MGNNHSPNHNTTNNIILGGKFSLADKKSIIENWPLETGDYMIGDIESPIAVVSLGSKMNEELINLGVAIAGPLHTENLGIEKVVANIVSNPNIRYLIVCGSEVQGHITGQTLQALYDNGIDTKTKSILGSQGAIPFVENLDMDAIKHFQDQITLINMVDNENLDEIKDMIDECKNQDPGAYKKDALIINLDNKPENTDEDDNIDDEVVVVSTSNVSSDEITKAQIAQRIRIIDTQIKQIAESRKLLSGYYAGKIEGIVLGFIMTIIILITLIIGV